MYFVKIHLIQQVIVEFLNNYISMLQKQKPTYDSIYAIFNQYNYYPKSLIAKDKLYDIFNRQSLKKLEQPFSKQLFQQLWEQTEVSTKGEIAVTTISQVIIQACEILEQRIQKLQGPTGFLQNCKFKINETQKQLKNLETYYYNDDKQINKTRKQLLELEVKLDQFQLDYKTFQRQRKTLHETFYYLSLDESKVISSPRNIPQRALRQEYSSNLLFIFHFTNVIFILELFVLSHRLNFFTLICILQCYYFLFVGYLYNNFVIYLLIQIGGSILFDISYLVINVFTNIYIAPEKSSLNSIVFVICLIVMIFQLIMRVLLILKLLPYRTKNNKSNIDKSYEIQNNHKTQYFTIFGQRITLNKPKIGNRFY